MQGKEGDLLGAILGFTAVVGLSIAQVIEKQRKLGVHPIVATWVQYAFASAISIPFALAFEGLLSVCRICQLRWANRKEEES